MGRSGKTQGMKRPLWTRILKICLWVAVAAAIAVGALAAFNWDMLRNVSVGDAIEGAVSAIPDAKEGPAALTPGEADWTCWRGPDGNGISRVTGIRTDWTNGLRERWSIDHLCHGTKTSAWSTPVVQGNRLVTCGRNDTHDLIFCLDTSDGGLIWKREQAIEAVTEFGSGARATPTIAGNLVYTFGRSGNLNCWQLSDGINVWATSVLDHGGEVPQWGLSSSPVVLDGMVIVGGGGTARTIAFDSMTGALIWQQGTGHPGYSTPVACTIGDEQVLLHFHGDGLAAMRPSDGSPLWEYPFPTSSGINATTPVVAGERVFITAAYRAGCAMLRMHTDHAEELWKGSQVASAHSDPIVVGAYLYGYSGQSWANKGSFFCLELKTGEIVWETDELGYGTIIGVDGYILAMNLKGDITLVKPSPTAFEAVASQQAVIDGVKRAAWTAPVVANGNLYIRYKQQLKCFSLVD